MSIRNPFSQFAGGMIGLVILAGGEKYAVYNKNVGPPVVEVQDAYTYTGQGNQCSCQKISLTEEIVLHMCQCNKCVLRVGEINLVKSFL